MIRPETSRSSLLVIIVNYRTAGLTIDCLRSLCGEMDGLPSARAVVVDGASADDSVVRIEAAIAEHGWSDWASVLPLSHNGGFAYANNQAVRASLARDEPADLFMLLNPDTVVKPGAVSELCRFLQTRPSAGIVGSLLEDDQGRAQPSARRTPSPLSELDAGARLGLLTRLLHRHIVSMPIADEAHRCDWVSGAAMIVPREVFEQIGLLDEGYFLYFEELDFCDRARKAGWEIWHVPASRVVHREGAATGISQDRQRRMRYWYESRRRYFVRQHGMVGLILADLAWSMGRGSLLLRRLLRLGGSTEGDPRRFAADLLGGDLRALVTGRLWQVKQESLP